METSFVAGMVCGALIAASFAAWGAFCEWSANRFMRRIEEENELAVREQRRAMKLFDDVCGNS